MRKSCLAFVLPVVAVGVFGVSISSGTELKDLKKAPPGYAREVEVTDAKGQKTKEIVYSTLAYTISPQELNQALSAYQ